mgnify:CR=1 FL=1
MYITVYCINENILRYLCLYIKTLYEQSIVDSGKESYWQSLMIGGQYKKRRARHDLRKFSSFYISGKHSTGIGRSFLQTGRIIIFMITVAGYYQNVWASGTAIAL